MTDGLRVSGLTKRFDDVVAIEHCDLEVGSGQLIGFLGPNGAGKSTTMRSIMGLIAIDAGSVTWRGQPIDSDVRRRFGYMPQERGLYKRMRAREQIEYFGRLAGLDRRGAAARAAELLERVDLTVRADDEVQELSGGNQQRVQLAVALVHQPELLILDEPFAGLDPIAIDVLRDIITEQTAAGVSVLFSSHQLDLVQELCREVVIIDEGLTIARGESAEIRAQSEHRILQVEWADHTAATEAWAPTGPDGIVATPIVEPSGRTTFRLPSSSDPAALMASTTQVGKVASFRFEPPSLDAVFAEIVRRRRSTKAELATGFAPPDPASAAVRANGGTA